MESESGQQLNPWISIWTQPRATIQQIIDGDPEKSVLLLVAIAGFGEMLGTASSKAWGDKVGLASIIAAAAIAGPLSGIIGLYLGGMLIHWTGKWLGGRGIPKTIRAAIAWSNVPAIEALVLWVPALFLFGQELFMTETPAIDRSLYLSSAYMALGIVELTVSVWAFIILLKCLGQVQGFSAWKTLGNVILAAVVLVGLLLPVVFAAVGLSRFFG